MTTYSKQHWIDNLGLLPHPEGGYYKETYRSGLKADFFGFEGGRSVSTGIYFMLGKGDFSAFHRIKSDEMWHFYDGSALEIHIIHPDGKYEMVKLGRNISDGEVFQYVVPADSWFGSRLGQSGDFALVGCTVAPGFDFKDFDMPSKAHLINKYPDHEKIIRELSRQ
ncbi:cupin domain-containing protein [Fulvivirga sediminis]|uniref:Cupin domain-containing protein n=1 Tax=Fulvivirga sediminis TaxID=2803949 RepID=A0A937F3U1_9BACT|nr:cupin domain-containing protein [Fulvivirga sediminis]MBL3655205.1 cupin domain-containing protein [Fulvivirga sediminis]